MGGRMNEVSLLNRRVLMRGIELGRVVDVILDGASGGPIGLDVRCGAGDHRFLPLATARVTKEDLEIDSPLLLLKNELEFYRSRGRALRAR
jgi:hypothetical protein